MRAMTMISPRSRLARCLLVGGAALLGACSATLDFRQCQSDSDCKRFTEEGPLRCNLESAVCVTATCKGHDDCGELGADFVCGYDNLCVEAVDDACEFAVLPGDKIEDPMVVIGGIVDASSASGKAAKAAMTMAVEDFNAKAAFANGGAAALMICDGEGTEAASKKVAEHLVTTVGVTTLLGPQEDDLFVAIAEKVSLAAGNNIFSMSPTAIAPLSIDDKSLVWRTTPSAWLHGHVLKSRITAIGANSAVVLFHNDRRSVALFEAVTDVDMNNNRLIMVDGLTQQTNLSYVDGAGGSAAYDTLVGLVKSPDLLIIFGGEEVTEILAHVASQPTLPGRIIVSDQALAALPAALAGIGSQDFVDRLEVLSPVRADPTNGPLFAARFAAKNADLPYDDAVGLGYDATMVSLLAMRTVPKDKRFLGPTIAAGMVRLSSGVPVSFNDFETLAFVETADTELGKGASIDLTGVSGDLKFEDGELCAPFVALGFGEVANPAATVARTYSFSSCAAAKVGGAWDK